MDCLEHVARNATESFAGEEGEQSREFQGDGVLGRGGSVGTGLGLQGSTGVNVPSLIVAPPSGIVRWLLLLPAGARLLAVARALLLLQVRTGFLPCKGLLAGVPSSPPCNPWAFEQPAYSCEPVPSFKTLSGGD
jgi:hypothetical protein